MLRYFHQTGDGQGNGVGARVKIGLLSGIIIFFLLLQLSMLLSGEAPRRSPPVQNGLLDATGWSFSEDGLMYLDGSWSFYPNELADPLQLPVEGSVEMKVPHDWRNDAIGQNAIGNGTYEALVLLPPTAPSVIGVKVTNIRMAHRLYINGELLHESGNPSESKEDYRPLNTPYTVYMAPAGDRLHIVIQASNFKYYQGGIAQSILIGDPQDISRYAATSFGIGLSGFYMTASFGLYALFIYLMRTRERMYMYAGLFFLSVSLSAATADEKVMMVLLDGLPFELHYKLQDFSLCASLLLLFAFFRTVEPAFLSNRVYRAAAMPLLLYTASIVLLPYEWYVQGKMIMSVYLAALCVLSIVRWLALLRRAPEDGGRRGERWLMLFTVLFVSSSLVSYYMHLDQVVSGKLISSVSYFSFIFTINLFLALCSTNMMKRSEELSDQLWRANELKNDFLQRTSHELKTPLHGIRNLAEHLSRHEGSFASEQQRQLGLIADTTERLSYIVNDLIDASRLKDASLHMQMSAVDLSAVVEHVFQIVAFQLGGKPISLVNRVPVGTFVRADEQRLQQIVYNLASNAVKYSSEGLVSASVGIDADESKLTISDQGIGIAETEWELVFLDTYRSEAPGQPLSEGMGLGLFISRELARKMDGDLYVAASRLGEGTDIVLKLNASESPSSVGELPHVAHESNSYDAGRLVAAGREPESPDETERGENDGIDRKTLLLVDDDPANIEVLKLILQQDYRLLTAFNGESALEILERRHVDLMIADLIMPGMSGIELTRRVRQRNPALSVPIIIATAHALDSQMQLAYQAGATDYVAKPFGPGEIRKRVQLLLQLSATMEAALGHERAFLAAQIKPHFLYNALNNIIALCYEEPERAAELLALLSRHLRRMFQQESVAHTVSLRQELDMVNAYIEIEKLRFEERLLFVVDFDPGLPLESQHVKTLLIQPLVENAVCHGIFNKLGAGTVTLRLKRLPEHLQIVVEDDGVGMKPEQVDLLLAGQADRGVGLTNVRRRIDAIRGASFELRSKVGSGTTCILKLPLE